MLIRALSVPMLYTTAKRCVSPIGCLGVKNANDISRQNGSAFDGSGANVISNSIDAACPRLNASFIHKPV